MKSVLESNRRHDIVFYPDGRIDIMARVGKLINIEPGDAIDIMTDGEEYFLYVRNKRPQCGHFEAQCFLPNKCGRHFRAYSARLCAAVREASGQAGKVRLAVGETREYEGRTLATLIIHNPLPPL